MNQNKKIFTQSKPGKQNRIDAMSTPLITQMRQTSSFMRSTAFTVLITFSMLILQPTVAAAQQVLSTNETVTSTSSANNKAEARLSRTLQRIEQKLAKLEQKLQNQQDSTTERNELKNLQQALEQQNIKVQQNFAEIEQHILDHRLASVILERHQTMVANYQQELAALQTALNGIKNNTDNNARLNHAKNAKGRLKAKRNKRSQQPFDPEHLPFQSSTNKNRPPKETSEELQQLIQINEPVQVAVLELTGAMLAQASPSLTPNEQDLSPTEDIQITDEIKALAAELGHHPVKIYNWVRNNIEYLPTYGSIQGSQMTLDNLRGNSFDTASLLIALLRASNIPARYGYGTVQIPIEKVMNWVGGVESPLAALELMGQGGIPVTGVTQGGVIKYVKMEQLWVEGWVDYFPSRAAKNKAGDSWIAMDASFKQYDYLPGLDKNVVNGLSRDALIQWQEDVQSNTTEGWSTGFESHSFNTLLSASETILDDYLEQIDYQFFTDKTLIAFEPLILALGLPYKVVARSNSVSRLPNSMRQYFQYKLYASETDRVLENPVYTFKKSLPTLAGKQISIGFKPARKEDLALLKSYLPIDNIEEGIPVDQLPTTLPAYLVKVTAELKIDGQVVANGGDFTLGQELSSVTSITRVTGEWHHAVNHPVAGEYYALGIDLQGITDKQHQKQPVTTLDSILHQSAIAYFSNADAYLKNLRSTKMAITYRLPSFGLFGSSLSTVYNFGIPRFVIAATTQFDVDGVLHTLVTPDYNTNQQVSQTRQIGMYLSALEHQIPQVYLANNDFPGQAVSSISAIAKAVEQGQRIYSITTANINTALSALNQSIDVINDIRNAINAGMEAVIPQNEIQIGNWYGTGYMLIDPKTGSAAYRISGGSNGMNMDNEISRAVAISGMYGGANIAISWPEVSADAGVCGEKEHIQVPIMDMITLAVLMRWLLLDIELSDDDCGCGAQPQYNVTATLILWFRDANKAFGNTPEGCLTFISGRLSQPGKEMWATSEHIQAAQGRGSKKLLTWKKPTPRSSRKNKNRAECNKKSGSPSSLAYIAEFGMAPSQCDEYPFNSTFEGDPNFYLDRRAPLSLKLVPASHNSSQGGTLAQFYFQCHLSTFKIFEVQTDLSVGSKSRGLDGNGVQCYP